MISKKRHQIKWNLAVYLVDAPAVVSSPSVVAEVIFSVRKITTQ